MKLLLVRHATAVPGGTPGILDAERCLTARGEATFRTVAHGLARITPRPDVLLTSPSARAHATADIAAQAFGHIEPRVEPALAGESVDGIVAALGTLPADATVVLVGHEPVLGALGRMLGAAQGARLAFKKGGAALVDLPDGPAAPGRLVWFIAPRVLRTLADSGTIAHTPAAGNGNAPHIVARVLALTATTGIYLVRGLPRDLQRAARSRAASEATTLGAVLVRALGDYAAGTWPPRRHTT